jgi:hypothetical protein
MVAKTLENFIQYFLHLVLYSLCAFLGMYFSCEYCCILCLFVVNLCVFVVLLCVFVVSHVYLLYFLCVFVVLCVLLFLL